MAVSFENVGKKKAIKNPFLGTFEKLRKTTCSYVMSVPSAWNYLATNGQIFMKVDI